MTDQPDKLADAVRAVFGEYASPSRVEELRRQLAPQLTEVLQALYASEINASVSCMWDGGWDVRLGDVMNGFDAEAKFANGKLEDAAAWLEGEALRLYPDSDFAKTWRKPAAASVRI